MWTESILFTLPGVSSGWPSLVVGWYFVLGVTIAVSVGYFRVWLLCNAVVNLSVSSCMFCPWAWSEGLTFLLCSQFEGMPYDHRCLLWSLWHLNVDCKSAWAVWFWALKKLLRPVLSSRFLDFLSLLCMVATFCVVAISEYHIKFYSWHLISTTTIKVWYFLGLMALDVDYNSAWTVWSCVWAVWFLVKVYVVRILRPAWLRTVIVLFWGFDYLLCSLVV